MLAKPKRNAAWKDNEHAIAREFSKQGFKAKRRPKHEQLLAMSRSEDIDDVEISGFPFIKLDGKHSERDWKKIETLFLQTEIKYVQNPGDWLGVVTHHARSKRRIAHIRLEILARLCALAYLGQTDPGSWVCPRCKTSRLKAGPEQMGHRLHLCTNCGLEFAVKAGDVLE